MRAPRNPFYMRATHQVSSDAVFLKLYATAVLEALPGEDMWDKMLVLRSSPGGGKTSLLRLFTPSVLLTLHSLRKHTPYDDLFKRMESLGAVSTERPTVLGALLSCAHDYSSLENLELDQGRKDRALTSLLNARIVLGVLRAALALKHYRYPDDLERIRIEAPEDAPLPPGVPIRGSGEDYYRWACDLEQSICETIDSIDPPAGGKLVGHDAFFPLWLLQPHTITCDGRPIAERFVVMLDDVHKLRSRQRQRLLELLTDQRAPTHVWVAERLAALSTDEILSPGDKDGRDAHVVYLESYWRRYQRRFEVFAGQVADKRADWGSDGRIGSLEAALQPTLGEHEWQEQLEKALASVRTRVQARVGTDDRFSVWLSARETRDGSLLDRLVSWRSLEILVERELRKSQTSLEFEPLAEDELASREESAIRTAGELFLHGEFAIPYYYSFGRVASLSSSNIEQFLDLAGEVYEQISASALLSSSRVAPQMHAAKQEQVLRQAIRRRWDRMVAPVNHATAVRNFLDSVGAFCRTETYRPTAPYSPGVSGIAITMADRDRLRGLHDRPNKQYEQLASVIAECIAANLLEADLDYKCKGQRWMVLYLNRMLCPQFGLTLQYGGWRDRSLKELCTWVERGYRPSRSQGELL